MINLYFCLFVETRFLCIALVPVLELALVDQAGLEFTVICLPSWVLELKACATTARQFFLIHMYNLQLHTNYWKYRKSDMLLYLWKFYLSHRLTSPPYPSYYSDYQIISVSKFYDVGLCRWRMQEWAMEPSNYVLKKGWEARSYMTGSRLL